MTDVVVIGAGLAGLTAALRLARAGKTVTLTTKGPGGLQLSQGTVDIMGYTPDRVSAPLDAVAAVADGHPYASVGAAAVSAAVSWLADELARSSWWATPRATTTSPRRSARCARRRWPSRRWSRGTRWAARATPSSACGS